MVTWTGMVAVKMERNRTVEQVFRRDMNFNHSYTIWYVIFTSAKANIFVFISARYRRMHFANIGCLFSLAHFFLEKKVCAHIASELCLGYSEAKY